VVTPVLRPVLGVVGVVGVVTPDPVGPTLTTVVGVVEFPKLNDDELPLITEGPVVGLVSGVTVVLSTGPVVVIVTVGPGSVTVTVGPPTVTVTVCPGAAGLETVPPGAVTVTVTVDTGIVTVTVTVDPGAGIVTVEPGAVTVHVEVEPGTVTVTVGPGAPGGQTVTVEGGGQFSPAKAREYKRKKIDRDFMAKSELENDGGRDYKRMKCRKPADIKTLAPLLDSCRLRDGFQGSQPYLLKRSRTHGESGAKGLGWRDWT
jgi:hypothetical protein